MTSRFAPSLFAVSLAAVALVGCGAEPQSSAPANAGTSGATVPTDPIAAIDKFIAEQKITKSGDWKTRLQKPPKLAFDDKTYFWQLDTNKGPIKIKLFPKVAPMHVSSTIYLTKLGFYDGLTFHRVIPGFMAQGGDPLGSGSGGPGYSFDGEFDGKTLHTKPGILSMANRSAPDTDGSQFFITFVPTQGLDNKHTVFGEVVDGMETVRALEKCGNPDRSGKTSERLEIKTATVAVQ